MGHPCIYSLVSSGFAVVCAEVGDNTFFLAVILSMNGSRLAVFTGALLANALMHAISVSLGYIATVIPHDIIVHVSTFLIAAYGLKMLWSGYFMSSDKTELEFKEAEKDIEKHEKKMSANSHGIVDRYLTTTLFKSFSLTILCEWGDRSQISTVLMSAHGEAIAVLIGGILGHAFCLILATVGGNYIGQRVSVRAMTICGGLVFLLLAMNSLFDFS